MSENLRSWKLIADRPECRPVLFKVRAFSNPCGDDCYFPYVDGVGRVDVPEYKLVCRPIVITDGMNGCALEVRQFEDGSFRFYHDKNCLHADEIAKDGGKRICRIEADGYMSADYTRELDRKAAKVKELQFPAVFFMCVYAEGCWHLLASGVCFGADLCKIVPYVTFDTEDSAVSESHKLRYYGVFSGRYPLIRLNRRKASSGSAPSQS